MTQSSIALETIYHFVDGLFEEESDRKEIYDRRPTLLAHAVTYAKVDFYQIVAHALRKAHPQVYDEWIGEKPSHKRFIRYFLGDDVISRLEIRFFGSTAPTHTIDLFKSLYAIWSKDEDREADYAEFITELEEDYHTLPIPLSDSV